MKTFYALNRPTVLLDNHGYTRLFNAESGTLAARQIDHSRLIGSEMSNSPSCTLGQDGRTQVTFSAYGASVDPGQIPAFKGELQDLVTGHYLLGNGHRAYNPALMRFNSSDRLSPFSNGGLNSYAFTLNDPINGHDPTGKFGEFLNSAYRSIFVKKSYRGKIIAEFDGIVAFTGPDRSDGKLPTLYLVAHGKRGKISGDRVNIYTADDMFEKLENIGIEMPGRQTHVFACDSSLIDPTTGTSFIEALAHRTHAQSSGYSGTVWTEDYRQGNIMIVDKKRARPFHDMVSTKTRAGNIRNPEKLNPRNREADFYNA